VDVAFISWYIWTERLLEHRPPREEKVMSQEQKHAVDQLMRESPLDFAGDLAKQRAVLGS
jgi:hypothetical protein